MEIAERRAALARVVEGFAVGHDRMLEVHGLRLPKHLAYAVGFWQGMTDHESDYADGVLKLACPYGVAAWLRDGRFESVPPLAREPTDAPEMLSVFGSVEERLALWYDEPAELPRTVVYAVAGDTTFTWGTAVLALYGEQLAEHGNNDPLEDTPELHAVLGWLEDVRELEQQAYEAEGIEPFERRAELIDGVGAWIDGWKLPGDLGSASDRRSKYKKNADVVKTWIATAGEKLASEPGWALVIGRELHSLADAKQRAIGTELLVAAYRALGRDALAVIAASQT